VTGLSLTTVELGGEPAGALHAVPAAAGVGQILGPEGRNLVIGRGANLRRWAASHLGLGPPPKPGARPRTNLCGLAVAVRYATTDSEFGQRHRYERLMGAYVSASARRDLKPPVWLSLAPQERFPRVLVRDATPADAHLFGPFRDRAAAVRARDLLHKKFALRPCDYTFEPHPELALGQGCLYAQVRSCAAPCLSRVSEEDYRALAAGAASFLASPDARAGELPAWVARLRASRALVAERTRSGWELFALAEGHVVDEQLASEDALAEAIGQLRWDAPPVADDHAWVTAWLYAPKRKGTWQAVGDGPPTDLAASVRAAAGAVIT
jgi:hypothetical protein